MIVNWLTNATIVLVTRLKVLRGYGSCKKKFVHFESQKAINLKFIVSLAKTLVDYFLPGLDTIIFYYFWKADTFLQNFLQSGHLFIYSVIFSLSNNTTPRIRS